jgi:N-acetylmuramoyl-L-alanine amidase
MSTWLPHVVRRGECLSDLAYRRATSPELVWTHPKNAELKAARPNPEVLAPGDLIWLPQEPARSAFDVWPGATVNAFATIPSRTLSVRLIDDHGAPLVHESFSVVGGKASPPAMTDGAGQALFEVPLTAKEAVLSLSSRAIRLVVRPGRLDPLCTLTGAVGRLQNLGYGVLEIDGLSSSERDEYATFLLAWFQRDQALPATGTLDEATRAALSTIAGDDGTWAETGP